MTKRSTAAKAAPPAIKAGYSDDTGPRIRAFLASVRPLRGGNAGEMDQYRGGQAALEKLANSAEGMDPPSRALSLPECADVVYFMSASEPLDEATWFSEPDDAPSHLVGQQMALHAVESSLRSPARGVPWEKRQIVLSGEEITETPVARIDRKLTEAQATLDLVLTLAGKDGIEELCTDSLDTALYGVLLALREIGELVDGLLRESRS